MAHFEAARFAICNGSHSVCGMCFSLNKSTSYLSLCLSLNYFCDDTLRNWASLDPETKYHGFWLVSSPSYVGLSIKLGFGCVHVSVAWVRVPNLALKGFESPSEENNFNLASCLFVTFHSQSKKSSHSLSIIYVSSSTHDKMALLPISDVEFLHHHQDALGFSWVSCNQLNSDTIYLWRTSVPVC